MSEKKVLVLGANGMLGKMISLHLNSLKFFEVTVSSRSKNKFINDNFEGKFLNLDIDYPLKNSLDEFLKENNDYKYIVNCIGVIKPKIDERKNIVSSTRAASRYIKNSNFLFENWIFSIYSYYQGLSGAKAVTDPKLYGSKRMSIDKNTHWYIIKFLGYKVAFENYVDKKKYNENYSIYDNRSFSSIRELSKNLSINRNDLTSLNKWITSDRIPNDKIYSFLIPENRENVFKKSSSLVSDKINNIIEEKFTSPIDEKINEVISRKTILLNGLPAIIADSSDSVDELIKLYGISKKSFFEFNDLNRDNNIVPGVPYYLSKKRRRGKVQLYIRREDESLWEISQLFGVQLTSLKKLNKENNSSKILLRRRSIL